MASAQGALEYLIIIAAVMGIAAVVVYTLSGVMSSQSSSASIASCKQESQTCKLSKMSSPNDPCLSCDTACANPTTGQEIFPGATYCCVNSETNKIYAGSAECSSPVTIISPSSDPTASSPNLVARTDSNAVCSYRSSTGTYQTMSTTGSTTHSQLLTGLITGPVTFYVRCIDAQGKSGETSKSWTVDAIPPTVTLIQPTAGATVSGSATPLMAQGTDLESGIYSIYFEINGLPRFTGDSSCSVATSCLSSPCSQTMDTTHYNNGPLKIKAVARDKAQNAMYSTEITVTVSNTCAGTCCGSSAFQCGPYTCFACPGGYYRCY